MRITPLKKYSSLPCTYVGTGCAYEDVFGKEFNEPMLENLKDDGWPTLDNTNKYVRSLLPIKKKVYYKQSERIKLKDFLVNNTEKCLVCVYGRDYWGQVLFVV